jgi:ABC-2 type transport system ATP-binding protein
MDSQAPPVIETTQLVKTFGRTCALDGLDFRVGPGEVHGFLGPNGAGKSTTLRILLGLIKPSAGIVRVLGVDPWQDPAAAHREVAYVPGDVSLWPNLTGGEDSDLLIGLRGGADARLRDELIEEFDFDPRRRSRNYSKGNRQKAALIAAFARPAQVYLLDEPSSGLDPVMDAVFRRHVQQVHREGATVVLSSHILGEVEQLCDRITIIRSGVAVETGTLEELRHLKRTHFRITGGPDPAVLTGLPGVHDVRAEGTTIEFDTGPGHLGDVLAAIATSGPADLVAAPPSLESLFLRHYGHTDGRAR